MMANVKPIASATDAAFPSVASASADCSAIAAMGAAAAAIGAASARVGTIRRPPEEDGKNAWHARRAKSAAPAARQRAGTRERPLVAMRATEAGRAGGGEGQDPGRLAA
mmetsp:Transcript_25445/g.66431  ORF Transcript_25445/g.66431 Transcript_25445/m.66431 type:complete len:109 (-) Transcript_25445:8-334(-)